MSFKRFRLTDGEIAEKIVDPSVVGRSPFVDERLGRQKPSTGQLRAQLGKVVGDFAVVVIDEVFDDMVVLTRGSDAR